MSEDRPLDLRGRDGSEALEMLHRALVEAGYEASDRVDVLGRALVAEALRGYWAEGLSAVEVHHRLCAEDPDLGLAVEALAFLLLGRDEARDQREAAVAAVELLLADSGPDRDQLRFPLDPDAP